MLMRRCVDTDDNLRHLCIFTLYIQKYTILNFYKNVEGKVYLNM